ncbi:MAG: hypothetical protein ACRCTR_00900 [Actinomycetota bacterium]
MDDELGIAKRQLGVWVVLVGLVIVTIDCVALGVLVFSGQVSVPQFLPVLNHLHGLAQTQAAPPVVVAALFWVVAVGLSFVVVGFWRWRRWAWVWVMLFAAVLLSINIAGTVVGSDQADLTRNGGLALGVLLVLSINRRTVQRRFGADRPAVERPVVFGEEAASGGRPR